jgi:hypothetical protein
MVRPTSRRVARGQALVEFSLALTVFILLLMGVLDFGMSIYKYNGVAQAAREIARVASVHQGSNFDSAEITDVIATQKALIPGLEVPVPVCTDIDGHDETLVTAKCPTTAFVKVTVTAPYQAVTPLLGLLGTWTMTGSSSAQVQQ